MLCAGIALSILSSKQNQAIPKCVYISGFNRLTNNLCKYLTNKTIFIIYERTS